MQGHGPDLATFEKASAAELKPHKIQDSLAFMWESRWVFRPTRAAMQSKALQQNYDSCWDGYRKLFKGK
jgi:homogentisate 1,2-dioxygenase